MACKYKVKGSEEWLSEKDFKIKLAQGGLDALMADNNIKIKGLTPTTTKQESAPRAVEQTAPDTSVVAKEKSAATTGVSEYKQAKATVRGASVDGYSVKVSEDGKKAQVKLPNKKESDMLPVKQDSAGREYVIGPNGSTVYLPSVSEAKVEAKTEAKKEAPQEKKEVRRKPIKGIDKDSSPKAKEIAEKLKFSPNEFTGEQTLEDVGLIDALEVADKDTGRKVTKMKPMRAIINAAYDKGQITAKERDVLEDALEEKTKAFNEAKKGGPSKREEIKAKIDEIAEGLKQRKGGLKTTVNPFDYLPKPIVDKIIDIAANLAKGGVDAFYAIREAMGQVLAEEVIAGRMTEKEANAAIDAMPNEDLLNVKGEAGIKKALTPKSMKEMASSQTERMTHSQLVELAKEMVDKGEINPSEIVSDILSGKRPALMSGVEVAAMVYYKAQLDKQVRDLNNKLAEQVIKKVDDKVVSITRAELKAKEVESKNYYITADIVGYETSLSFSARKIMMRENFDAFYHIKKAISNSNNGKIPEELEERFKELEQKYKELEDEIFKKEQEIDALKNQNIIDNIKDENESIKKSGKQKATTNKEVSSVNGEIKVPTKLIRDLVEGGIDNVEDLVDAIQQKILDKYPNATTRQIRDAISAYARTRNMNRDEVKGAINIMKSVGRMISELEDLEAGIKKTKLKKLSDDELSDLERANKNRAEVLREKIKQAFNNIPLTEEEEVEKEEKRLEAWKKRKEEAIKKLTEKLNRQDYSKDPKRKEVQLDRDAQELKAKHQMLKDMFALEHEKFILKERKIAEKLVDGAVEAWNAPQALMASVDFSAPARQGILPLVSLAFTNPSKAYRMFVEMHKFGLGKESVYEEYMARLKSSPEYIMMKEAGVDITDQNAKISAREEAIASNWARKIPFYGKTLKGKVKGKDVTIPGLDLVGRSERAYSGFLNQLRAEMFITGAAKLQELGYTMINDKQVFKDLALHINNSTGRGQASTKGKIGERFGEGINSTARVLSPLFFSPKLIISRINTLANPIYYARLSKPVQKMALKQIGAFYTVMGLVIFLAKMADDDDDENYSMEIDPRSSDFAKLKFGDTTIDFTGGYAQYVRLLTQVSRGEKKMRTGEIYKLGSEYNKPTTGAVVGNWLMNKMSPWANYITKNWNLIEGSKLEEEFNKESSLLNFATPIWIQDVGGLYEKNGALGATGLSLLSIYGFGVGLENQIPKSTKRRNLSSEYGRVNNRSNRVTEW